jgi:hypothetical protein
MTGVELSASKAMQLDRTNALIRQGIDPRHPRAALVHVLESALELVSLADNDFSWSSWADDAAARAEIETLIEQVRSSALPDRISVSVLFTPTGPLQEVSLSSGWSELYLKVAERFDEIERLIW